jgi:hypothetical protein
MKDELARLFEHETDDAVPAEHAKKIRAGLGALLAATPPPPTTPDAPPSPTAAAAQTAAGVKLTTALVVGLGMAAGGFAIGRSTAPTTPPASVIASATPIATTSTTSIPAVTVPVPASVDVTPSAEPSIVKPSAPPKPTASSAQSAFDREQSLLERARSALVRHDAGAAQEALDACEREFPKSRLGEERDYLRIQLHRERGETALARERARAFLTKYPDSLLRARVEPLAL